MIIEDNVNCFPALTTAGVPFVRIVSCQPLEMKGPHVPPAYSGLPADDRSEWDAFRAEYDRTHRPTWQAYNEWVQSCGARPLADLEFIHESDDLNLYTYPEVIDYTDRRPLGGDLASARLVGASHRRSVRGARRSSRRPTAALDLPVARLARLGRRRADATPRRRARPHTAPLHRLARARCTTPTICPANMWGAQQVPQTNVLPLVDLVITHGGNNTTTECFHFGKPMVVLPLFWDQYDNAQRVHETGYGVRLPTYSFDDAELTGAVDRLLADTDLHTRMAANGAIIRSRNGTKRAAELIEDLAR